MRYHRVNGSPDDPNDPNRDEPAAPPALVPAMLGPITPPVEPPPSGGDDGGDFDGLRRVVAAIGGAYGLGIAVAIAETPGGPQLVLTTSRGRAWLPPGAVVPADALNPWDHPESARWVGLFDPGRVLREWAAAGGVTLTAMVVVLGRLEGVDGAVITAPSTPQPDALTGPALSRVEWQAAELAADAASGPDADDPSRQAWRFAQLAHQNAPDPRGIRAAVLRYLARYHVAGTRYRHPIGGPGHLGILHDLQARQIELTARAAATGRDVLGVPLGCQTAAAAAGHAELLATLYADDAVLAFALATTPDGAREVALYSAAMAIDAAP